MFLPLGDEPNPRGVPIATYTLIGINVAIYLLVTLPMGALRPDLDDPVLAEYVQALMAQLGGRVSLDQLLAQVTAYDLVTFSYGYRPVDPSFLTLGTSMFLHGGFMHLAGNMLYLWIYGDNVEHRLGPGRFLIAYLGTGALATLSHAATDLGSVLPMVGASGAISGVLGFYFIWFPRNRVRVWVMFFPFFMNMVYFPARFVLGVYLILDNLLPFLATRAVEGGGVAYGAHLGGFVAGLAYAWWSERREVSHQPTEYETPSVSVDSDPSSVRGIRQRIVDGSYEAAAPDYFQLSAARTTRLLMPEDSIQFANWLANNQHPDAALIVYQRHLRDYPLGPYSAEAHLGAGLVQLYSRNQPTAAYQHLVMVLDAEPHPDTESHARSALAEIASRQKFQVGSVH
jgi:membrane associated rhomboid family serine protease|tara:strand:+ start:395 stop:1591 length:1197 start_codon:yes stop_codon:yes gene_type:complete